MHNAYEQQYNQNMNSYATDGKWLFLKRYEVHVVLYSRRRVRSWERKTGHIRFADFERNEITTAVKIYFDTSAIISNPLRFLY